MKLTDVYLTLDILITDVKFTRAWN